MENPYDIGLVVRALEFAAQKHRMQRRKDGDASPYINHPIALVHVLCIDAAVTDPVVLAAAALHDTIEDTETSEGELRRAFGSEIASIVAELSDDKALPKGERKRLQIDHAQHATEKATGRRTRRGLGQHG
jgi:GTP diphosphokinase / guanosine-3',5'-bis(diphosphate) 3'-diphosphatase